MIHSSVPSPEITIWGTGLIPLYNQQNKPAAWSRREEYLVFQEVEYLVLILIPETTKMDPGENPRAPALRLLSSGLSSRQGVRCVNCCPQKCLCDAIKTLWVKVGRYKTMFILLIVDQMTLPHD